MSRLLIMAMGSAFALTFISFPATAGLAAAPELSGHEIMRRAVTNSNRAADRLARQSIIYSKLSILEEINEAGRAQDREERLYQVLFRKGKVQMRLVQLDGKPVSGSGDEADLASNEAPQDASKAPRGEERPLYITAPTIEKYSFELVGQPEINGRGCFELTFEPRANLKERNLVDRFLNQLKGRLWVDTNDFEIVRAQIHLRAPVTLWGGVLGALKRFDYTLERERLQEGFWFNRVSSGDFELRKLIFGKRFRTQSEWKDVRTETTASEHQ